MPTPISGAAARAARLFFHRVWSLPQDGPGSGVPISFAATKFGYSSSSFNSYLHAASINSIQKQYISNMKGTAITGFPGVKYEAHFTCLQRFYHLSEGNVDLTEATTTNEELFLTGLTQ